MNGVVVSDDAPKDMTSVKLIYSSHHKVGRHQPHYPTPRGIRGYRK